MIRLGKIKERKVEDRMVKRAQVISKSSLWLHGANEEGSYTIWEGPEDDVGDVIAVFDIEEYAARVVMYHNAAIASEIER